MLLKIDHSKHLINWGVGLVFLCCVAVGYQLTLRKVLWNDELYTQVSSIEASSYGKIIKGDLIEGNNAPLFYVLQKTFLNLINYRLPQAWIQKEGNVYLPHSQVLLRSVSICCMSLALALMLRYFWIRFSLGAGLLVLLTSMTSYMVLAYWVEARPYALWFLLTVMQFLLFLKVSRSSSDKKKYGLLALVHWLLSFTVVISLGQILVVSLLLWLDGCRKLNKYIVVTLLPVLVCIYYFYTALRHGYICPYRVSAPLELIEGIFTADRLYLMFFSALVYWAFRFRKPLTQVTTKAFEGVFKQVALYGLLIFFFTGALLAYYKYREQFASAETGNLNCRFFIYLAPLEIMATVLGVVFVFRCLWQHPAKGWAMQYACAVVFFYAVHILILWRNIVSTSLFAY